MPDDHLHYTRNDSIEFRAKERPREIDQMHPYEEGSKESVIQPRSAANAFNSNAKNYSPRSQSNKDLMITSREDKRASINWANVGSRQSPMSTVSRGRADHENLLTLGRESNCCPQNQAEGERRTIKRTAGDERQVFSFQELRE